MDELEKSKAARVEAIIAKILSHRKDIVRPDLDRLIENKKKEANYLLNDEGATFLVASQLGVSPLEEELQTSLKIKDIFPFANDVSIVARVLAVYPAQEFTRKDGVKGTVRRILAGDESGCMVLVLWNEQALNPALKDIAVDNVLRISHAYSKDAADGRTELHVGTRGEVAIATPEEALPVLNDFFVRIEDLKSKDGEIFVDGIVTEVFPPRIFERVDGTGRVMRFKIKDDSGEVTVVCWNELVEQAKSLRPGHFVRIIRGRVKKDSLDKPEIHVDRRTILEFNEEKSKDIAFKQTAIAFEEGSLTSDEAQRDEMITPISGVVPGARGVTVEGILAGPSATKEVTLKDGTKTNVVSVELEDGTGTIRLSAWRNHGEIISRLVPGTRLRLRHLNTRIGLRGKIEISTSMYTQIEILSKPT